MKLTIGLLLFFTFQAGAGGYAQRITIVKKNVHLAEVFRVIEQQTGYLFFYDKSLIQETDPLNVTIKNATLDEALTVCLKGQHLTYTIVKNTVVIRKEKKNVSPHDQNTFIVVPIAETPPIQVHGTVKDDKGNPLLNASVLVKGTNIGVTTDANGNFKISVSDKNSVLIFSYTGYQKQEIEVSEKTIIDVKLMREDNSLNEVVVTALGISKEKKALAYAVSEVKGEELTQAREANVANSLSGKVAGVNVTGNATGPGGSSRVIIRGNGSLAGNNQPLYVVNGMPIDNTIPGGGTVSTGGGNNIDRGDGIADINPDDIETITVLKGGAAAALYGSRASNGVILITTKKGKYQKGIGVELNSTSSFETPALYPDWQYEYGQGIDGVKPQTQRDARSTGRLSFGAKMDGEESIQLDGKMHPYSPVHVKDNINNFYRIGETYTNTVAFTGGAESINFRLSLSNMDAKAILPNSSINRKTANLSVGALLGKRLSIQGIGQYNLEKGTNRPKVGYADHNAAWATYLVANTVDIRTLSPGYDENFNETLWNASSSATNPYFVINRYSNGDLKNRFIGQLNIKYDLFKNVFARVSLSQDYYNFNANSIIPTGTAAFPLGSIELIQDNVTETNSLLTLNYSSAFLKNFNLAAMLGGNRQKSVYDETRINGSEFTVPFFYSYTNASSVSTVPIYNQSKINSIFGSLDVDYKRVAFVTFTARNDWFSTLSPRNNNILYPSVGGSLILSQIFKLPSAISFLKVRGSWAQVGGATPEPYILNQTYSMVQGGHNGRPVQELSSGLVTNPDLRPLTSTTDEVGLDVQLFDSRIAIDLTLYNRKTTDDIVKTTISNASGYTQALLNVGEVSNKGIELMLNLKPINAKNFKWNINYNFSYNKSEILRLSDGLDAVTVGQGINNGAFVQNVVGKPYGTVWGFLYKKSAKGETVYNSTSNVEVRGDLAELGVGVAPTTMGLTNNFQYKNFTLNILLDGKFGNTIWSNTNWYATRFGLTKFTLPGRAAGLDLKGVDQDGRPYSYKVPVVQIDNYYNSQQTYTGLFAYDGSFIKLRQIILGYKLPVRNIGSLNIQSASVSIVARNLFTLYRKTENFDPESSNTSDNAQGLEGFGLPRTKSIGINLSLKF